MRDIINNLEFKPAIVPVAAAQTDNTAMVSTILDRRGYESVGLAIVTGTLADADATFAVTIDHGDAANLSDAVAVPADQLNGTLALAGFTFAHDSAARKLGYAGGKRYVRATVTPTGNTGAAPVVALWVLGGANLRPTPATPAA
jgi:hypothetical protein